LTLGQRRRGYQCAAQQGGNEVQFHLSPIGFVIFTVVLPVLRECR
jgi:hypothetical protein